MQASKPKTPGRDFPNHTIQTRVAQPQSLMALASKLKIRMPIMDEEMEVIRKLT